MTQINGKLRARGRQLRRRARPAVQAETLTARPIPFGTAAAAVSFTEVADLSFASPSRSGPRPSLTSGVRAVNDVNAAAAGDAMCVAFFLSIEPRVQAIDHALRSSAADIDFSYSRHNFRFEELASTSLRQHPGQHAVAQHIAMKHRGRRM